MKVKTIFLFLLVFAILVFSFISVFSESVNKIDLNKGKNFIKFNKTDFYVETLVKLNPSIESVSYTENNKTVGYVNVFGGIGRNFVIEDREYEITAKKNLTLALPYVEG